MDLLDELGIAYESVPGVSSFCGAAAALNAEYTLPGVSQSVVITRMAGRTPVPDRESIRSFSAHGCSMVIFLSSGLTEGLQSELLLGGYREDTPVAIVYKATWPDEKKIHCTVGTLHQSMTDNGISSMALILVGGFLGNDYMRSKLMIQASQRRSSRGPNYESGHHRFTERALLWGAAR
jgi:precorrin-4/cobalt-precorrin-4 C11-methyltransferase